jgi:hypothetical protein
MIVSFFVAVYFEFIHPHVFGPMQDWKKFTIGVLITTCGWLIATFVTKPTDSETLVKFYRLIKPGGPGWKNFLEKEAKQRDDLKELASQVSSWDVPSGLLCVFLGCLGIYGALFGIGFWVYSNTVGAVICLAAAVIATIGLMKTWSRLKILDH